ncbi:hypothetical protein NPIL_680121 [Nephila pilipes]|uniref:Uncharacterized protein n=1 Tax=Nephila pilipes TaxID=299642 RepID=A0A8X6NRR4_NEPPI|nr:hypothetical protein NPIL_680121 [Nephila pilipes]
MVSYPSLLQMSRCIFAVMWREEEDLGIYTINLSRSTSEWEVSLTLLFFVWTSRAEHAYELLSDRINMADVLAPSLNGGAPSEQTLNAN